MSDDLMIVPRPEFQPGHCIVTQRDDDPMGYIDTGLCPAVVDPRVYVSVSWVLEMARKLDCHEPCRHEIESRDREIKLLTEQLADADKFADSVAYTLNKFDTHVVKKPGRKPKFEEAA